MIYFYIILYFFIFFNTKKIMKNDKNIKKIVFIIKKDYLKNIFLIFDKKYF